MDVTTEPRTMSALVCAYTMSRWVQLIAAVRSLEAQEMPLEQIIVVIDHNDELLAAARAEFHPHRVVPNTGPRGLSGARNTGLALVTADVLGFLDDDAVAAPDWSREHLRHYAPGVIGTGGHVVPRWTGTPPRWFPEEFRWVLGCSYEGLPTTSEPIRNAIGANMTFRRDVFDRVGPFVHGIGRTGRDVMGCEETELSIRARRAFPSSEIVYVPSAVVEHEVPGDRQRVAYFLRRCYGEGRSKRLVAGMVGTGPALRSERAYATRTLPRGLARNGRAVLVGRSDGATRALAIVGGVAAAAAGFSREVVRERSLLRLDPSGV